MINLRTCEEVKADLEKRNKPYRDNGWIPTPIPKDAILHRLIREADIDSNTNLPKSSVFTHPGMSVLVEGFGFPKLDITKEVAESSIFVGAVALNAELLENLGFELYHDPHPDPLGRPQHPNHAQVVCKKTQSKAKQMRDRGQWSVCPLLP